MKNKIFVTSCCKTGWETVEQPDGTIIRTCRNCNRQFPSFIRAEGVVPLKPRKVRQVEVLPGEVEYAVKNLVWMARRYADGRLTGAPDLFNESYDTLKKYINFDERNDPDNRTDETRPIKNFPYATNGNLKE